MSRKTVLIIGATGSTGKSLIEYLDEEKYVIYATGREARDENFFHKKNVKYVQLDITNEGDFSRLPAIGVDTAVLLAGVMPARMKNYDPQKYIDVNVTGTLNVAEYMRKTSGKKIIFAQSHSDVAGYWDTGRLIPHDAPRSLTLSGDHSMYIISKCAAVDILEHYNKEFSIKNVILRLPTIYTYDTEKNFYVNGVEKPVGYILFIDRARAGQSIEVWGDSTKAKDIVYVKDFDQIVQRAIDTDSAQGVYNVGSGVATTLEQQIQGAVEVFSPAGKKSEIIYAPEKPSQVSYLYDISRTESDLGYVPQYTYIDMLHDIKREFYGDEQTPTR